MMRRCLLVVLAAAAMLAGCYKSSSTEDQTTASPTVTASCTYTYSNWGTCASGTQTRTVASATPEGCTGTPVLERSCVVEACAYTYSAWSACAGGTQTRTYESTPDGCAGTPAALEQACNMPPTAPTYSGATTMTEPCGFTIALSATDSDGSITYCVMTGGTLPPGHSLAGNVITGAGLEVTANTIYIASFAAIDNTGQQGPSSSLTLTCNSSP